MIQQDLNVVIQEIAKHLSEANIAAALAELQDESIYHLRVILNNIDSAFTRYLFDQPEFVKLLASKIHQVAHLDYIYDLIPVDQLHNLLVSVRRDVLRAHINSGDLLRKYIQQLPTVAKKSEFLNHLNLDDRYHDTHHVRKLLLASSGFKAYYSHKHTASYEEAALFDTYLIHETPKIKTGEDFAVAIDQVPAHKQLEFLNNQVQSHGPRFLAQIIHDAYELNSILSSIHFSNVKRKFLKLLDQKCEDWVVKFNLEDSQATEHLSEFAAIKRFMDEKASKGEQQVSSVSASRRGSESTLRRGSDSSGRYREHALKRW